MTNQHNYHHLVREWCKTICRVAVAVRGIEKMVEAVMTLMDLVSFYSPRFIHYGITPKMDS